MNREIFPGGIYPLTGDVNSTSGQQKVIVVGLQNIPVSGAAPADRNFLQYSQGDKQWEPTSFTLSLTVQTGNYTTSINDDIIEVNSSSATTIILTVPVSGASKVYTVKNINTGVVTIQGSSGTIEGASSIALSLKGQAVDLYFDGTNFWIF